MKIPLLEYFATVNANKVPTAELLIIEFGDSYQAPPEETGNGSASESFAKKIGRIVAITTKDMQKRRNDVKARTTLLLALPDEHQLRFNKYETAQKLWGAILKTFGGNEATKKTKNNQLKQQYGNFKAEGSETLEQTFNRLQAIKRRNDVKARTTLLLALPDEHQLRFSKYETAQKLWGAILKTFGGNEATKKTKNNQLKQQYGNFKAEGSETLEQTFNRLQAIVSHLEFMDVKLKQNDLNKKFLTSLAPEWLMYTIVWRNRDDLDTMSLDYVYNHLKVYEPEVQKKSETNSQNMAFISSSNTNSGKSEVHTASVSTVSTASTDVAAASISHDTVCVFIAFQSNGSQIKYEDITQIDEDDIEEIDIKWNMALLSMRADKFWKKTGKKITIQGSDVASFDKSKVECFNCHKMGHFARECRAPRSQDRGRRESYKQGPKEEEQAPKALMAIDEFALMAKSSSSSENEVEARLVEFKTQEIKFYEKIKGLERDVEVRNNKIENLMNELEQVKKEKEVYSPLKKDMSWTRLPEFADDTVTDYSRPTPSIDSSKSNTSDLQNSNPSISKHEESSSSIMSKPMIKFVKTADCPKVVKTNKIETARKSPVKYDEMYRSTSKSPKVTGQFPE
nr:hypothetical protein [Tanacetum cinerariifolium]